MHGVKGETHWFYQVMQNPSNTRKPAGGRERGRKREKGRGKGEGNGNGKRVREGK